jgi:general transcription factor 3C polypeptide 5 (transcription factor C subunit 1)
MHASIYGIFTKLTVFQIINCIDPDECIPLYLRYQDRTSAPILSQSTSTQNIVLKITVPKRTGRRRKKGSQDPFTSYGGPELPVAKENAVEQNSQGVQTTDESRLQNTTRNISGQSFQISTAPGLATARENATGQIVSDVHMDNARIPSDWGNDGPPIPADLGERRPWEYVAPQMEDAQSEHDEPPEPPKPALCSHSRMDTSLRRKLNDNVGKYTCEAVAEVKQTHRFRGEHPLDLNSEHLLTTTGLADFHQSTTHLPFFSKFRDLALSGNSMC